MSLAAPATVLPAIARAVADDEAPPSAAAICGIGLVSALGCDAAQTWQALLAGRCIDDHAAVAAGGHDRPRVTVMALSAARQAIASAGWTEDDCCDAALVVGTSKGPVERWLISPSELSDVAHLGGSASIAAPALLGDLAFDLAGELGLASGPRLTISSACASGLHALIRGEMLVRSRQVRRALVVAAEAAVHPLFVGSFRRLGVVAAPSQGCRPFDEDRGGFLLADAAAAVCLEPTSEASATNGNLGRAMAVVEGCAIGADATHLTGGDPDARAMRRLIGDVVGRWTPDLVHAHGTGTATNDQTELAAIEYVLDQLDQPLAARPHLYSHKGALGHSLGAAGLVATVINCQAAAAGVVPPNVRTTRPLPARRVIIDQAAARRAIHRSVVLAAGFGGTLAALSLRHGG